MNHVILTIAGINCNNFDTVQDIVAESGYSGSMKIVDECTRTLDIGSDDERKEAGIMDHEVRKMIANLVLFTSVNVSSKLAKEI